MTDTKNRSGGIEKRLAKARLTTAIGLAGMFLALLIWGCASSDDKRTEEGLGQSALALSVPADAVPCNAWANALVANRGSVVLNSQTTVDSYRSAAGPYGGSNVTGGVVVRAATSITNNGGVVQGQLLPSSPSSLAVSPVPSGAIKLPLGSSTPGTLTINTSPSTVTLAPGNYVVANLTINGPGSLKIAPAGLVRIWVTGNLTLGGNENLNGAPRNLAFLVTSSGTVNVNGTGSLYGAIYAPTSTINLSSKIFGAVVGGSITLNSGGAVHFDVSSTTRDLQCSGHGSCPSNPSSNSTCACDVGWLGSDCSMPSGPPTPPRPLPKPPSQLGCYWYTLNGWEAIPCEPVSDVINSVGVPAVPPGLSTPYVDGTPNPTDSTVKPLVPNPSTPRPFVYAQAELLFPAVGGLSDIIPSPAPTYDGCSSPRAPRPNVLSAQLNTNKFVMANGHNGAVQFALQSDGLNDPDIHMCAWQVDVTDQKYDSTSLCVKGPAPTRSTPLQPFDFVNIAGSVDPAAGTMSIVVQLSWVQPGHPNIYAQVGTDKLGLTGGWVAFDAAVLGMGGCSEAHFTDTSVLTRMVGSTCPGVTTADSSTSSCSTANKIEPLAKFENRTATAETNNLIQVGTPVVGYPNPWLAVTNVTQTTSGACLDSKHLFVRDYATDLGATPSNTAGQAFWESPDIFLVPRDQPVDQNSTPAQSLITPNGDFDVYVRVRNDLGCAQMTGAKALVYIADPSALSTAWAPLTNNEYQAGTSTGIVPAGGVTLLGPFRYHAPLTGFGDGHKCLIASISADGEAGVANYFDAPNSNQVAQRNVQLENCAFPVTNATGSSGQVELTLSVAPPEAPPSLSGTPNVSITFDDDNAAWYGVWVAQPENGTAYAVTRNGTKTVVRLGKASVTLKAVPLANGDSRAARGGFDMATGASTLTLALQAALKNPSNGSLLAPVNGGSCLASGGPIIK